MGEVILNLYEENSVIIVSLADLSRQLWRPKLRIVAPVTLPLKLAPRITHLYKADLLTLYLDLMDRDHRVGMTLNYTINLLVV